MSVMELLEQTVGALWSWLTSVDSAHPVGHAIEKVAALSGAFGVPILIVQAIIGRIRRLRLQDEQGRLQIELATMSERARNLQSELQAMRSEAKEGQEQVASAIQTLSIRIESSISSSKSQVVSIGVPMEFEAIRIDNLNSEMEAAQQSVNLGRMVEAQNRIEALLEKINSLESASAGAIERDEYREDEIVRLRLWALIALGDIYMMKGDLEQALDLYDKSKAAALAGERRSRGGDGF